MKVIRPIDRSLEKRVFQYKNVPNTFYCPLCVTPRAIRVRARVTWINHVQFLFTTLLLTLIFFPIMEWRGLVFYFLVWAIFEIALRVLFKKEVPCPHCGFDATWYHRDVKEARKRVAEFWAQKNVNQVQNS